MQTRKGSAGQFLDLSPWVAAPQDLQLSPPGARVAIVEWKAGKSSIDARGRRGLSAEASSGIMVVASDRAATI